MWRRNSFGLLGRALTGLQQQQQQHAAAAAAAVQPCLQLEVLGLGQAVRHKISVPKPKPRETRAVREAMRREHAFRKAAERLQQAKAGTPPVAAAAAAEVPSWRSKTEAATEPSKRSEPASAAGAAAADGSRQPVSSAMSSAAEPGSSSSSSSSSEDAAPQDAAASPSSSSSSDASGKSWTPSWLRSMFDGRGRGSRQQGSASPLATAGAASPLSAEGPASPPAAGAAGGKAQPAAAGATAPGPIKGDGWEELDKVKDMSLDDYVQMIKNEPGSDDYEAPPLPLKPFRGPYAFYRGAFDMRRVRYLRYEQHVSFVGALRPQDKLMIKLDKDIIRNEEKMQYLSDVSGHDKSVVADAIHVYRKRADMMALLWEHRQAGNPMPPTSDADARDALLERLEEQKRREREQEVLEARDIGRCQLRVRALVNPNPNVICPQTQLRFRDCCGHDQQLRGKRGLAPHKKGAGRHRARA